MDRRIHALFFILGGLHQILAQCPSGSAEKNHHLDAYNGVCYEFIDDYQTWEDAAEACDNLEGDTALGTIVDAYHDMWIKEKMIELDYTSLWTGLRRLQPTENSAIHWQWIQEQEPLYYQGCYAWDDGVDDDYESKNYKTPLKCIDRCIDKGKDYAAIGYLEDEDKDHTLTCRCGNTFLARDPRSRSDDCTLECEEDPSQMCGSNDRSRVYSTKAVGEGVTSDSFWQSRQPNNADEAQHCLALDNVGGRNFRYADERCYVVDKKKYGHICQYDLSGTRCEAEGFTYFSNHSSKCYKVFDGTNSWYEARAVCLSQGGDLASIKYRDFFDSLVENDLMDKDEARWWIGGTNENWQWEDGSAMVSTAFADEEPSGEDRKNCVMKKESASFGWTMQECVQEKAFFCQLGVPTTTTSPTTTTTPAPTTTTTTPTTTKTPVETTTTVTAKATPTTKGQNSKTTTTKKPAKTTKDTVTNPEKSTTTKGVPTTRTPNTRRMVTTEENTAQPGSGEEQKGEEDDELSTGIIVAIVVAGVAVLAGFIRLLVYCCQRRSSYDDQDQSIANSTKGLATSDYNNPAYSDGYNTGGKGGELRPMDSTYITPENGELTPTTNETFAY